MPNGRLTLRERAAKALGCYPLQVRIRRLPLSGTWAVGREKARTWAEGTPTGYGATQAEAVADLERKAQARQEG